MPNSLAPFFLLLLAQPGAPGYAELAAFDGGTVTGRVRVSGPVATAKPLPVTKDMATCGAGVPDERVVAGEGGALAGVVVLLDGIGAGKKTPRQPVLLDQQACRYVPHVLAFPKGTTVQIKNSDPLLHNTHAWQDGKTLFNVAFPIRDMVVRKRISKPGVVRFTCDAGHGWMEAWAYVTDHPYVTVTGADGAFSLTDVPPGEYTLKTWHATQGERRAPVRVEAGRSAAVEIAY